MLSLETFPFKMYVCVYVCACICVCVCVIVVIGHDIKYVYCSNLKRTRNHVLRGPGCRI